MIHGREHIQTYPVFVEHRLLLPPLLSHEDLLLWVLSGDLLRPRGVWHWTSQNLGRAGDKGEAQGANFRRSPPNPSSHTRLFEFFHFAQCLRVPGVELQRRLVVWSEEKKKKKKTGRHPPLQTDSRSAVAHLLTPAGIFSERSGPLLCGRTLSGSWRPGRRPGCSRTRPRRTCGDQPQCGGLFL